MHAQQIPSLHSSSTLMRSKMSRSAVICPCRMYPAACGAMVNTALQPLHEKRHDGPFRTPQACAPPLLLHSPVHLPQVPCVCARNSSMYPEMCSHAPCINGSWTLPATGRPLLANHCSRHMAGGEEYRDEQVAYDAYFETSWHKFPMLCKSHPLHDNLTLKGM